MSRFSPRKNAAGLRRLERILAASDQVLNSTGSAPRGRNQSRRRPGKRSLPARLGLIALALVILLVGYWVTQPDPSHVYPVSQTELKEARNLLAGLEVRKPSTQPKYDRAAFGPAWADEDHNGCDTRNDILARDLTRTSLKPGTKGCTVLAGTLEDRYTGKTIEFKRGQDTSTEVQIDHVVALADSWRKGASKWSNKKRQAFANDPINLLAVDGPANQEKSSLDASEWVPSNREFRCQFAIIQIRVKAKYNLWVTQAEHKALDKQLNGCKLLD